MRSGTPEAVRAVVIAALFLQFGSLSGRLAAQQPRQSAATPQSPKAAAQIDLTGYWVSVVTEDWRFRMMTPAKGDLASVPLNDEGFKVANAWDQQRDRAAGLECKAYGAANIMRVPGRLRITWQDEENLKIETDAGQQVRVFNFNKAKAPRGSKREWQGRSVAEWEDTRIEATGLQIFTQPPPSPSRSLKVVTTQMRAGYLRTNGVPYSEDAVLSEYFDIIATPWGDEWLIVTSVVDDPRYLVQPFITSTHFKREADGSKWNPRPCELVPLTMPVLRSLPYPRER